LFALDLLLASRFTLARVRTIGEVAELAGVTSRTLRYYDRIGLLKPLARSQSGYRLYGREELLRLREILVWRRLGFPLSDIAALIDEPGHDLRDALERQLELATANLESFDSLARGLETAIAAVDGGGPQAEEQLFGGLPSSGGDEYEEDGPPWPMLTRPRHIPRFAPGGSPPPGPANGLDVELPRRIVASDPIRIAENLLALGIVPVGSGCLIDWYTGQDLWPWPGSVEGLLRDRIGNVGWYGMDKVAIERLRPDLIIDLLFTTDNVTLVEARSSGFPLERQCSYDDLCAIAPVTLLDAPIAPPGFLGRLETLAQALEVEDRLEPLVGSWRARTSVLREHLSGQRVAALNVFGPDLSYCREPDMELGTVPTDLHEGQLFTAVGLELVPPPDGAPISEWGDFASVTAAAMADLAVPTLFLTVNHAWSVTPFHRILREEPLAGLPPVKAGRAFDLGWVERLSGWFSAHAQLDVMARAFGVQRLRTADATVFAATGPGGKVTVASLSGTGSGWLRGPTIDDVAIEFDNFGGVVDLDAGRSARHLCAFPEAYTFTMGDDLPQPLVRDRESAIERVREASQARPAQVILA
jgi:DNA-binding transcriptional MerR regulator/ABC-type Fe3+-hydroxamate transport system substrate-binding protein